MKIGRVIGRVISTHKDPGLSGRKLLVIQPVGSDGVDRGKPFLAADAVGAGAGETVITVRGREGAHAFLPDRVPTDAGVVGVVDEVFVDERASPGGRWDTSRG